ncbi:hypothetical protein DB346_16025 [Verrucomicrobia bacterium LW23]|nr:hypothetical protein DB346_16025 [Verrucomicrobia bacterium LW23]
MDVEVFATAPMPALASAWEWSLQYYGAGSTGEGGYLLTIGSLPNPSPESEASLSDETADALILRCCNAVERLPPDPRREWDTATRRSADIGIDSGLVPSGPYRPLALAISPGTLARAAAIGLQVAVTVYAIVMQTAPRGKR